MLVCESQVSTRLRVVVLIIAKPAKSSKSFNVIYHFLLAIMGKMQVGVIPKPESGRRKQVVPLGREESARSIQGLSDHKHLHSQPKMGTSKLGGVN